MRILIFLFIYFFLAQYNYAQIDLENDFPPKLIAKNKVKYVEITVPDELKSYKYFNDDGLVSKEYEEINGKIILKKFFKFSTDGKLIKILNFSDEGKMLNFSKISYNENKSISKVEYFEPSINENEYHLSKSKVYYYDTNMNNIKIEEIVDGKIEKEIVKTTENNKLIFQKEINHSDSDSYFDEYKYFYDEKGRLEKSVKFFSFSETTISYSFKYYNENLIEIKEKSSNGASSVSKYFYDSNSLLKEITWKGSLGKILHSTTYKYFY